MPRPIIGIVCSETTPQGWTAPVVGAQITYPRAIEAAGGVPMLIYLTHDHAALDALYRRCDGVLLIGGDDLDPALYGEARHPQLGELEPLRDEVEMLLARRAFQERKPLFGICRGIQSLNVALGGSLYQDIPSQIEGALNHRESSQRKEPGYLAHRIQISPDSWLAGRLDCDTIMTNTMHHQSLKAIAPGMRVTAHAPDGVVEAFERTDSQFVLGVQCHPERLWDTTEPRWRRVFEGFIEEVIARAV